MDHERKLIKSGKEYESERAKHLDRTRELEKEREQLQKIVETIRNENEELALRNKQIMKGKWGKRRVGRS